MGRSARRHDVCFPIRSKNAKFLKPDLPWEDPFLLEHQLAEDERLIRD